MSPISTHAVKVADEVWIATALLHRKRPAMLDFTIEEIVESARSESITGNDRPGVYVHVLQHCVANRSPNPGRYCMLFETEKGRRRLWKPGDRVDPKRIGAKTVPIRSEIPLQYHSLLDWYESKYAKVSKQKGPLGDPILGLKGLGQKIWDESPDEYVRRLREGWK
jgi:hypothetical protein